MNVHRGAGLFAGRPFAAAIGLACFAVLALVVPTARAVVITGSTFASDTGDPFYPPSPGTPPNSPQSKSFNIGNPTSASTSVRSDVTYAHAQSAASASIGPSGLTKSTSGRAWLDTTFGAPNTSLYNTRGDLWNASASGTQLTVNGPAAQNAPFTFFIPGTTLVPAVQFPPNSLPTDPTNVMQPRQIGQQGFFADNGNLTGNPNPLPSFFKEYVQIDANFQIIGQAIPFLTFHGGLIYNPSDNTVTGTGDFASAAAASQKLVITGGGAPIFNQTLPDISIATDIPTNTPFDAIINMSMSQGDPTFGFDGNNPLATMPAGLPAGFQPLTDYPANVGSIGAGGSFAVQFFTTDTTGRFTLHVVPEPSTIALAAIGGLGMMVALCRRVSAHRAA